MTHTQAVFLGHWVAITAAFWLWCWYQSIKRKRACRHGNVKQATIKYIKAIVAEVRNL